MVRRSVFISLILTDSSRTGPEQRQANALSSSMSCKIASNRAVAPFADNVHQGENSRRDAEARGREQEER
jgi:hypothetical protein